MAKRISITRFYDHRFGGMVAKGAELNDLSDPQAEELEKAGLIATSTPAKKPASIKKPAAKTSKKPAPAAEKPAEDAAPKEAAPEEKTD